MSAGSAYRASDIDYLASVAQASEFAHRQMGDISRTGSGGALRRKSGKGQWENHPKKRSIARIMTQIVPTTRIASPTP